LLRKESELKNRFFSLLVRAGLTLKDLVWYHTQDYERRQVTYVKGVFSFYPSQRYPRSSSESFLRSFIFLLRS
jgi:hypothetical protein